jgi:hypothetical protein
MAGGGRNETRQRKKRRQNGGRRHRPGGVTDRSLMSLVAGTSVPEHSRAEWPEEIKMNTKYFNLTHEEQNAILRQHGYRWEKISQEWLDDNDDFETTPGWHLYAPDRREVSVGRAFDEIERGADIVAAEKQAEVSNRRICGETITAIMRYINEFAEPKQDMIHHGVEIIYDSRDPLSESLVGETIERDEDGTLWLVHHDPYEDGWGQYSRRLPIGDDEGFGNSNADIVAALEAVTTGKPLSDLEPFSF